MMMLKRLARANFFCDRFIHLCYNMFHKKGGGCMKTISLTENQFKRLTPFRLSKDIRSTEGSFFYLDKGNWDYVREELLFKKLYINSDTVMANKLFTISMLNSNDVFASLEEFVIPKYLVSIDGIIQGFALSEKKNVSNLGAILSSKEISLQQKLFLLEKVGLLLCKVHNLQKNNISFSFGDLHPYNFLVDQFQNLFVVDLDSSYFGTGLPLSSYYLSTNRHIDKIASKYHFSEDGMSFPDYNSDLFCYNMMILNTIAGENMNRLSLEDYYEYISYLDSLCFSDKLLQSFHNVYTASTNVNPVSFLKQIPMDRVYEAGYKVFQKKKECGII